MIKKKTMVTAICATAVLLPTIGAQTVLHMPEQSRINKANRETDALKRLKAPQRSFGTQSLADLNALEAYSSFNGHAPGVPAFSPFAPEDDTQYMYTGFNVAAGLTDNGEITGGLVNFNLEPFVCDTVSSHSGVSPYSYVRGDKLNCILPQMAGYTNYSTIQRTVYDANTLEFIDIFTEDVPRDGIKSYVPYLMTYDDQRDVVYAVTIGDDGNGGEGYFLNIFDEDANRIRRIGWLGSYVSGRDNADQYTVKSICAGYGTLYALISSDALYLAKLNPATCETTVIGRTGLPTEGQYGVQPMVYDSSTGKLTVNHYNFYDGTVYYRISTFAQDGEVNTELVENAPTGFTFFYRRPETLPSYYKYTLSQVDDLSVTSPSDTQIKFEFTVPSLLADGSQIEYPDWVQETQKNVRVYIYVDNNYIAPEGIANSINYGDYVKGSVDLTTSYTPIEPGLHTLTVYMQPMYNEIAPLRCSYNIVVGEDVPTQPNNVQAVCNDKNVTISWGAPSESRFADFGTQLDLSALTYTVVRDNDGKVVAENITATDCNDTIESDIFTGYSYTVTASVNGHAGQGATSSKVFAGRYVELPYVNYFEDMDCLQGWNIISLDNNGEYRRWQWNMYMKGITSTGGQNNDWLLTPPFHMNKGEVYELTANIEGKGTLEISYGMGDADSDMTVPLTTLTATKGQQPVSLFFSPDKDGDYRIGFHNYNGANDDYIWSLYDVRITHRGNSVAPGVCEEVKFEPETPGSYNGTVSALMPSITVDGSVLNAISAFVIYDTEGNELGRNSSVQPGQMAEVNLSVEHGWNYWHAVAENNDGEGWPVEIAYYAGSDIAKPVTNLKAVWGEAQNQLVLSWDIPQEGVNGGWIDTDNITYKIYQYFPGQWPDRNEIAEIFENEVEVTILDNGKQDQYIVSVTAVTPEGESEYANTSIVLGEPFNIPVIEPIGKEGFTVSPYINSQLTGSSTWDIDSEVYNDKVKSQNNDGIQLVYLNRGAEAGAARFSTPIIDFTGNTLPVMKIWVHHTPGMDKESTFSVETTVNGHDYETLYEPISLDGGNGWQQHIFDLSSVAGKKAQIGLKVATSDAKDRVFADNYSIAEAEGDNLAITGISRTDGLHYGDIAEIRVTVANMGAKIADDYIVLFNVNDQTVAEIEVTDALAPGTERNFTFPLSVSAGSDGLTTYSAEVLYGNDVDESDNMSELCIVRAIEPQLPAPSELTADDELNLTWNAPEIETGRRVLLDFEDVPAFTRDNIEGWTTIDGDGHLSTSFIQYYGNYWPYVQQPLAWMVWSAKEAGCPDVAMWQPYSGDNCLIAWGNYGMDSEGRDNSDEPEDDWFISPEVLGGTEFSFMTLANDMSCVLEVLVSTTDKNPESFTTLVTAVDYTDTGVWKEVSCILPENTRYVALHVKVNGFGIMVDDIHYTDARTPVLMGYNVYCDSDLTIFAESLMAKGEKAGLYGVSALYDLGESVLSNRVDARSEVVAIENSTVVVAGGNGYLNVINANGTEMTVTSIDGTLRYNGRVDDTLMLPLEAGIYIVRIGNDSVKVIVR